MAEIIKDKHIIYMIYATGCPQCNSMRQTINSVIRQEDINAELYAYNCNDDEAIDIALDHNINDVPGCNINGIVIEGENFNPKEIVKALKKLS